LIEAVSTHIPLNPCSYNPNSNPRLRTIERYDNPFEK
jgi:hypothetical protein